MANIDEWLDYRENWIKDGQARKAPTNKHVDK